MEPEPEFRHGVCTSVSEPVQSVADCLAGKSTRKTRVIERAFTKPCKDGISFLVWPRRTMRIVILLLEFELPVKNVITVVFCGLS